MALHLCCPETQNQTHCDLDRPMTSTPEKQDKNPTSFHFNVTFIWLSFCFFYLHKML